MRRESHDHGAFVMVHLDHHPRLASKQERAPLVAQPVHECLLQGADHRARRCPDRVELRARKDGIQLQKMLAPEDPLCRIANGEQTAREIYEAFGDEMRQKGIELLAADTRKIRYHGEGGPALLLTERTELRVRASS